MNNMYHSVSIYMYSVDSIQHAVLTVPIYMYGESQSDHRRAKPESTIHEIT